MKKALIFIGGSAPLLDAYRSELEECDICIAADSGYDIALRDHIAIDLLLGDMDSIAGIPAPGTSSREFPKDKDLTDTELAVEYVHDLEADHEIVLIGGGEGRFDHTMALISLFLRPSPPVRWYTALECLHLITSPCTFSDVSGKTIALLGITEEPVRVSTEGLFWELQDFPLSLKDQSVSNRAVSDTFSVRPEGGKGILVSISS